MNILDISKVHTIVCAMKVCLSYCFCVCSLLCLHLWARMAINSIGACTWNVLERKERRRGGDLDKKLAKVTFKYFYNLNTIFRNSLYPTIQLLFT